MHLLLSPLRGLLALEANDEGVYYRKGQGNISHTHTLHLAFSLRRNPQESYVWINHVLLCLHYGKISFLPFVSFAYINGCLWTPCVVGRLILKFCSFCFYIPSVICINYIFVAVRAIMTKINKTNKQTKRSNNKKTQNQKWKNSTIKRKVCFSLRFQKASVQHSEKAWSVGRSWKQCY